MIRQNDPPLLDATAPYNFIPYDRDRVLTGFGKPGPAEPLYSGTVSCRLTALGPLLVGDRPDEDGPTEFAELDGRKTIPGSSLKGLVRSMVETMSFSKLEPVDPGKLFWRDLYGEIKKGLLYRGDAFEIQPYRASRVSQDQVETIEAGEEVRFDLDANWMAQIREDGKLTGIVMKTGPFPGKTTERIFHSPKDQPRLRVPESVYSDFMEQMTAAQRPLWDRWRRALSEGKGVPVYYIEKDGATGCFGLSHYFRRPYERKILDLVNSPRGLDFAQCLFGTGGNVSLKGRVGLSHAPFHHVEPEKRFETIQRWPAATFVAHYLVQDPARVFSRNGKNHPSSLTTYNHEHARLRGRKLYWHRDVEVPPAPEDAGIATVLAPLGKGSEARFTVSLDRVSRDELGAVLEALDLPEGHAHKLGRAKAFGFGSVRIAIESIAIAEVRDKYASLKSRFNGTVPLISAEEALAFRTGFKEMVFRKMPSLEAGETDYESLVQIRALRRMSDFANRPDAARTRPMPGVAADEPNQRTYRDKAVLPGVFDV